jgi:apolipoprotein N-acyltransferase
MDSRAKFSQLRQGASGSLWRISGAALAARAAWCATRLVPGDLDFWPGPGPRTLDLPFNGQRVKVGMQICYEIIFSGQVVDRANRPDFIFNPSNDAWFGGWGPPQHLAQARLRAIEEGLPVVRATPTGISAVIDADGRVVLKAYPKALPDGLMRTLPRPKEPQHFLRAMEMRYRWPSPRCSSHLA